MCSIRHGACSIYRQLVLFYRWSVQSRSLPMYSRSFMVDASVLVTVNIHSRNNDTLYTVYETTSMFTLDMSESFVQTLKSHDADSSTSRGNRSNLRIHHTLEQMQGASECHEHDPKGDNHGRACRYGYRHLLHHKPYIQK